MMRLLADVRALVGSVFYAILFYGLTLLWVSSAALAGLVSQRAMLVIARGWGWMHRILSHVLLGQKVRVIGELVDGPMLFVFKHESMFETIDLLCFFRQPAPIAKRELMDIPAWGAMARRYGVIPLDREAGARALRQLKRDALAASQAGRAICLFPEGTRVPHGEAAPLKAGFAALYQLLRLPVVPIAVDSGRVSPRGVFIKRPGVITYKVGNTIPPGLPRAEAEALVHAAINALNVPDGVDLTVQADRRTQ